MCDALTTAAAHSATPVKNTFGIVCLDRITRVVSVGGFNDFSLNAGLLGRLFEIILGFFSAIAADSKSQNSF